YRSIVFHRVQLSAIMCKPLMRVLMAKGGGSEIGTTKRGKGMKIMAIVDRRGLPLSVSTHAANHHQVRLVQLCFDFYKIEAKPENLIGDRAYDSDRWMRSCERRASR